MISGGIRTDYIWDFNAEHNDTISCKGRGRDHSSSKGKRG